MKSQQKPQRSSKLESLPADLREVADQLLAKKFPEDNPHSNDEWWGGIDLGFDEGSTTAYSYFRREYLGDWKVISTPMKFVGLATV